MADGSLSANSSDLDPYPELFEPDASVRGRGQAGIVLSRRQLLVGVGATSAAYATGAASANVPKIWAVAINPDPTRPTRSIIEITFGGDHVRSFREVDFGERAKAYMTQIPARYKGRLPTAIRDIRLTISGMELARAGSAPEFFELIFEFRHSNIQLDADDPHKFQATGETFIKATNWVFGTGTISLVNAVSLDELKIEKPLKVDCGTKIANAFRSKIFGRRLLMSDSRSALGLFIKLPWSSAAKPMRWLLAVRRKNEAFTGRLSIATRPIASNVASAPANLTLIWAPEVEIWREVPPPETGDVTQADSGRPQDAALIRTIGMLRDPTTVGGTETFLAEHNLSNKQRPSAILKDHAVREGTLVYLTRVDGAGRNGTPEIVTVAKLSGGLVISTSRPKRPPLEEGPFRFSDSRLTLSGPPDASVLNLEAQFSLRAAAFEVSTAHGPLIASSPEEKRSEPGDNIVHAPARLRASNGTLTVFELHALVLSTAIALKDLGPPSGDQKPSTGVQEHSVDLTFPNGREVLFRMHGLNGEAAVEPGLGRISLGWTASAKPADGLFGARFSLPMEGAMLRILRWRDLATMTYSFLGLDLTYEDNGPYLRPRGLAQVHRGSNAVPGDPTYDPRPMMIVELPPQHIAEEAFFEQREARPALPAYPLAALGKPSLDNGKPNQALLARRLLDQLRTAYVVDPKPGVQLEAAPELEKRRRGWRTDLNKIVDGLSEDAAKVDAVAKFLAFREAWDAFVPPAAKFALTPEQKIYVGPDFLDPAARFAAEMVSSVASSKSVLFDDAPEDPVFAEEKAAFLDNAKRKFPSSEEAQAKAVTAQTELARSIRDPFFSEFKCRYDSQSSSLALVKAIPELQTFEGRRQMRGLIERQRGEQGTTGVVKKVKDDDLAAFAQFISQNAIAALTTLGLGGEEKPRKVARARLSGPSRLAFRINTDDFDQSRPGGGMPLSIEELTNWSRHELAVVRRAEKMLKPYRDGSRRPAWDQVEDHDLASQLLHQGFTRGGWLSDEDGKPIPQPWPDTYVRAEDRIAAATAFATAPPSRFETAIEMPFRLFLSPAQDGRFRTRRAVPSWIFGDAAPGDKTVSEPLWTAELETNLSTTVRAVWSPDFYPEAFVRDIGYATAGFFRRPAPARRNRPPLRGPYAPWEMSRGLTTQDFQTKRVSLPSKFRTSLDAFDRHELVALTSLHGLPVMGRIKPETGARLGIDQREPPAGFQVSTDGWPATLASGEKPWLFNDVYVPRPLDPEGLELALSSLGGFLRVNASFEPPASILDGRGDSFFDALSIERWRHRIVLGRDISAEVVYKGYLFPIGIRCALIKITERRFQLVEGRSGPVAVLRQRMFLRIGKPDKAFPAFRQPDDGRRLPFSGLKLVTTVTPDIVDPFDRGLGNPDDSGILSSGLIALPDDATGAAFWPRTAKRRGSEVKFDLLVDGQIPVRMPLIFIDNAAANNQASIKRICEHYNALGNFDGPTTNLGLVEVDVYGAKLTYAPEKEAGDTQLETLSMTFAAEGGQPVADRSDTSAYSPLVDNTMFASDAYMQGVDQPPFYPAVRRARVKLGQVERLTTQPMAPVDVVYDPNYALNGFGEKPFADGKNINEVFLLVLHSSPAMSYGAAGDRGGAVGRGEFDIKAICRPLGAIGANDVKPKAQVQLEQGHVSVPVPEQLPDNIDALKAVQKASDMFNMNAKLLGLVSLREIIEIVIGSAFTPKLQELTEFGGGLAGDADRLVRERVLLPAQAILMEFTERLNAMKFNGLEGSAALAKIYPDVMSTRTALVDAIAVALAAPPANDNVTASLAAYTTVYTTGRGFVSALDRVLRDPVTPIREAGRKVLDDASTQLLEKFNAEVAPLLKVIEPFLSPQKLRSIARDILRDEVMKPLKSSVFSLPLPDVKFGLASIDEDAVAKALSDAIDAGLNADLTWPGVTDTTKQLFDFAAFQAGVASSLEASVASPLEARLKAEAMSIRKAAAEQLQGYIWSQIFDIVDTVDKRTKALQENGLQSVLTVLETLDDAGRVIGAAETRLLSLVDIGRSLAKDASFFCQNMLGGLDDLVHTILPIDLVEDLASCIVDGTQDCTTWDDSKSGPFALAAALIRFRIGVLAVTDPSSGKLVKLEKKLMALGSKHKLIAGNLAKLRVNLSQLANQIKFADDKFVHAIVGLNHGIAAYRAFSDKIAAGCTQPDDFAAPLMLALRSLQELNNDRLAVLQTVQGIVLPLASFLNDDDAFGNGLEPPPYDLPAQTSPSPNGDPALWKWADVSVTDERDASNAAVTARKDILGLVLPILTTSVQLVEATSMAGVPVMPLANKSDPKASRAQHREDLTKKLDALRLAADAQIGGVGAWLTAAHAALTDKTQNSYLTKIATDLDVVVVKINVAVTAIRNVIKSSDTPLSEVESSIKDVREALKTKGLHEIGSSILNRLIGFGEQKAADVLKDFEADKEAFERRVLAFLAQGAARIDQVYDAIVKKAVTTASSPLAVVTGDLASVFEKARDARGQLDTSIDDLSKMLPPAVAAGVVKRLKGSLYAYVPTVPDPLPKPPTDGMVKQAILLRTIANDLAGHGEVTVKVSAAKKLLGLLRSWDQEASQPTQSYDEQGNGPNAPLFILRAMTRTLEELLKEVLRGDVASIIDFGAIKQEIERRLRELIPSRITLAYDLDTEVGSLPPIFIPENGTRLTLKARTVIDLVKGGTPEVNSSGDLGPFSLNLFGDAFDIVTLSFDGAKFGSETGGKFKTNIVDVELGKMVEFLQQVSSYLSFSSNGFYIRLLFDPPGIEAGYEMPPMGLSLGVLGISNLSLTTSCILPFDGTEAMFKVGLSTPETPFLINIGVYGGGGHLALYATPGGIVGFEASFEFGAVVAFEIGPLKGNGRVTSGIFLRSFKKDGRTLSTIEGFVSAGGQASIAMFRFAALLQIRVGQQPGGALVGTAIFTFSFSAGIRDIKFRIVTRKQWGKGFSSGGGGVGSSAMLDLPTSPGPVRLASKGTDAEIAQLVAAAAKKGPPAEPTPPKLVSAAVCKGKSYATYQSYFADLDPWRPKVW
ncbi:hypothetical protein V6582_20790 (plasmid) [Agrobacterium vitis]|uniref:hypothetical protein n=1 Tax=Agrobacterium vitis TaxID=373 RepID=UPI0012E72B69|nr:hypothetical protein [Agrobacterium vitis]MVA27267.1 hypothetical protein [Agrobacterium vitis]